MRVLSALAVILVALQAVHAVSNNGSWTGVWRNDARVDDFGGLMTTCVDGTRLQGTFSAIGFVEGTTKGRNVTGTWKVGGYTDNVYGGFEWTLNADNKGFTGYYWYNDEPCVFYNWNSTRLENLLNAECQPLTTDTSLSIEGHWQAGNKDFGIDDLWICVNDKDASQFHGSYELDPRGIQAFVWGRTFDRGVSAQGSYYDNKGVEGMGIFKMTSKNTMVTYQYNVPFYADAFEDYYSPNVNRRQLNWTRIDKSSESLCNRHKDQLTFSWDGAWTDVGYSAASRFYVCTADDGTAWGVYNDFGSVVGTIKGNVFSGRFYDSGSCSACQGNFTLTLDSTYQSFSGNYIYDDQPGTKFPWAETRIDASSEAVGGCATLAGGSSTLQGRWKIDANNFLDICLTAANKNDSSSGKMEGSATFDGAPVYLTGVYSQNGQLVQFNYKTETDVGVGSIRLTGTKTLIFTAWETPEEGVFVPTNFQHCLSSSERNPAYDNGHVVQINTYDTTTTSSRCTRFSYLKNRDLDSSNPPARSAASSIVAPLFEVVLALVSLFFLF